MAANSTFSLPKMEVCDLSAHPPTCPSNQSVGSISLSLPPYTVYVQRLKMEKKVKEEVIEQYYEISEEAHLLYMEEEMYPIAIARISLPKWRSIIEQRNILETKMKLDGTRKKLLGHSKTNKQVVSDVIRKPERYHQKKQKKRQPASRGRMAVDHSNDPVFKRAKEVKSNLGSEFPTCIVYMIPSIVTTGFWLRFPTNFCKSHMPKQNRTITLVGENGEEYITKFIMHGKGLSGGWKAFSIAHNLHEGDVLVFQFIRRTKCKVYILRSDELTEVDGALALLDLDARGLENLAAAADEPENFIDDLGSNTFENMALLSDSAVDLDDVQLQTIENFTILVNGFDVHSKLSEYHKIKYYELCCKKGSYLHDHLLEDINGKLAAEMIVEIVKIVDAIGDGQVSTLQTYSGLWDKTLEGFGQLGMNVEFIRDRLKRLVTVASKSEGTRKEISELEDAKKKLDAKISLLKEETYKNNLLFQKELDAPW